MANKIIPFEELEKDLMNIILEENTSTNQVLRQQYESCIIESRKFTGVGFFTNFKVTQNNLLSEQVEYDYGNVYGKINNTDVGFILFVTNKVLFLEGFTHGDDIWPEKIFSYEIYLCERHIIPNSHTTFIPKPETMIRKPSKFIKNKLRNEREAITDKLMDKYETILKKMLH